MSSSSSSKKSEATLSQCEWSQLPSDLLGFICTKLTSSIADYIHFRSVCGSWRFAAKSTPLPPQIPFLILPTDAITRFFLNPINGKITPINLPQARGLALCGSSNGWLVFIDDNLDVSLLNPLTGSTIPLPSSSATFLGALGWDRFGNLVMDLGKIRHLFPCYVFMESYPNDPSGCVIAFTAGFKWLVYCRLGDARWTRVIYSSSDGIASLAYHKGKFYSMDLSGSVSVYDVGGGDVYRIRRIAAVPSLKRPCCCYMVVRGDHLLIVSNRDSRGRIASQFEIFKLDTSDDLNLRWEKLRGLGDLMLFLHLDSVCSIVGSEASGCKGNSVYSISRSETENGVMERSHLYDIESGITQVLPYHHNLQSKSEKSIWFTPKF